MYIFHNVTFYFVIHNQTMVCKEKAWVMDHTYSDDMLLAWEHDGFPLL